MFEYAPTGSTPVGVIATGNEQSRDRRPDRARLRCRVRARRPRPRTRGPSRSRGVGSNVERHARLDRGLDELVGVVQGVQIGTADPTRRDAHERFAGPGRRDRPGRRYGVARFAPPPRARRSSTRMTIGAIRRVATVRPAAAGPSALSIESIWRPRSGPTPITGRARSRSTHPHPRLDALARARRRAARRRARSTCPSRSTSRSSTWTGRAAATRTSRPSPPPTASSTVAASGTRATSAPTRARSSRATPRSARRSSRFVESVGADFGRVRVIKLEPQDHDTAFRNFHRDDNNRFNPDERRLGRAHVARAHRQSRQLHAVDGQRSRRTARSRDRDPRPAASGFALPASTRSGCGTWSCTTVTRRATR